MSEAVTLLTNEEIDAIGEIMNISMGSAATAVSTLLDRQVNITIPKVTQQKFENVNYLSLEPAMIVKIKYIEGISGANVMVFRQRDMQVILGLLMGMEVDPDAPIEFDELSMSAACEVMNQMMGSSATALSSFLGRKIDISTPEAFLLDDEHTFEGAMEVEGNADIVSVSFNIEITDVMTSEFISVMKLDLARMIVSQAMGSGAGAGEEAAPAAPAPAPAAPAAAAASAPQPAAPAPSQPAAPAQAAPAAGQPMMPGMPGMAPGQPMMPGVPAEGMPPYGYPPYPMYPYGYPMPGQMPGQVPGQAAGQPGVIKQPDIQVQTAQFPTFGASGPVAPAPGNMDLIMNVPLSVAVEIGKTKRKIKDIIDFNQGTVIELEKQAGAPVDIVVNGKLIARGDVVVINDNFGVRITEIIGTRDLLDTLDQNA